VFGSRVCPWCGLVISNEPEEPESSAARMGCIERRLYDIFTYRALSYRNFLPSHNLADLTFDKGGVSCRRTPMK
jgi:hypothetical protein